MENQIVITVQGGIIQHIATNVKGLQIQVLDFDHDDVNPDFASDYSCYDPDELKEGEDILHVIPTYYNSHGVYSTWKELINIEVKDRENCSIETAMKWQKKYNLSPDSECIWIATRKAIALRYHLNAEEWDMCEKFTEKGAEIYMLAHGLELEKISPKDGILIKESDDGDGGFIFIKRV